MITIKPTVVPMVITERMEVNLHTHTGYTEVSETAGLYLKYALFRPVQSFKKMQTHKWLVSYYY